MSKRRIASPSPLPEAKRLREGDGRPADSIYKPLPTAGEYIRVLELQPGGTEHNIECNLEIVDIAASKGSYEAISYVWGDANDTADVHCNGLQVLITVSLANALRNFRHPSESRLLWADALCINQKDDQEKGHQVKRMGQVYANAKRVLVWLGCDVQNVAKDTFALVCEVNSYFENCVLEAGNKLSREDPVKRPYPFCMHQDKWLGVASLFKFAWFRRVWTVQEVAIAKECCVFWGSASIDIADVLEICVWLRERLGFYAIIRSIVGSIRYRTPRTISLYFHYNTRRPVSWQQSRAGLTYIATTFKEKTLCEVLEASRSLEATDPRDHVYAFLGCSVAKDREGRILVDPDYTSSIHDLNIRLAYALMKSPTEGPLVLSAVRHGCRESLLGNGFPSWVPAWHSREGHRIRIMSLRHWYRASGSIEFLATIRPDKDFLTVRGCLFAKVIWSSNTIQLDLADSSPMYPNRATREPCAVFIDNLWDDLMQAATEFGISVRQDDFTRILMRGYPGTSGNFAVSNERHQIYLGAYRKSITVVCPDDHEAVALTATEKRHAAYVTTELREHLNARLFLTEHGRIGVAPLGELVEVGDVCCIVFGATVPFLLTPAKEGRHKLISECYVHGVMDGEIVQQLAESDLSEYRIVLE